MPVDLFVFGTLKRGYPLHARGLARSPFLGCCRTLERYPLVVAGRWFAPMMLVEPGRGFRIRGELFEVDEETLACLDRLESIGVPGNFRVVVDVEPVCGHQARPAFAYVKDRRLAEPLHSGCLEQYTDRRFIAPEDRPGG